MMEAISILGFILGVFGLIAFERVNKLKKQVYLLRSDLKIAGQGGQGGAETRQGGGGGGSCGCGGNC